MDNFAAALRMKSVSVEQGLRCAVQTFFNRFFIMRIPPVVKTLLLLNLAAFILDLFLPLSAYCGLFYFQSPYFHVWQPLTYMFMHGGFSHIFFNMFALWMFGRIMEQVWGSQRFLTYYLICGIGAGLVQEAGQLLGLISPLANTIGASGAVYGILLAFGMTFPNERLFVIPIPFPIKAKYFVAFYAAIELFEAIHMQDGVAHLAHLGGMLFGLILILMWRRRACRQHMTGNNFWKASTYEEMTATYDRGSKPSKPKPSNVSATSHSADYEYNARRKQDNEEIDRILGKIRQHGYAGLTAEEKARLFDASKR